MSPRDRIELLIFDLTLDGVPAAVLAQLWEAADMTWESGARGVRNVGAPVQIVRVALDRQPSPTSVPVRSPRS
jgi:hypothetical protein